MNDNVDRGSSKVNCIHTFYSLSRCIDTVNVESRENRDPLPHRVEWLHCSASLGVD